MNDPILNVSEQDLLNQLPKGVADAIRSLGSSMDWDAVGNNLAGAPSHNLALKGGAQWTGSLWQAVKNEFRSFLCTESPEYEELRKEWSTISQKSSTLAVAALSGAIGAHLGVASGVLAPLVIWALIVTLKMGKGALCQLLLQSVEGSAQPSPSEPSTSPVQSGDAAK